MSQSQTKDLLNLSIDDLQTRNEVEKIVEDLRENIAYHDHQYYVLNDPVISDSEYDKVYQLLKDIEEKWPDFITETSPTQRIGEKVSGSFPEVEHLTPMLSLDNSYNKDDLKEFDKRVRKLTKKKSVEYSVEPKLDGMGISLIYEDGKLIRGSSRGDGSKGEDITNNLRVLKSIPLMVNFSEWGIHKIEIRGEVIIRKDHFKEMNKDREKKGESLFANPRNAAAGSLRLQDPEEVAKRELTAWLYQVSYAIDKDGNDVLSEKVKNQKHAIEILHKAAFKTPQKQLETADSIEKLTQILEDWIEKRDDFPFEIDGLVVKVNDFNLYDYLGLTSHHPRWAIAYKFQARQGTTVLKDVHFQVGRTGIITPVAELEPVVIGGVTIKSASLHNEDFIKDKDIRINDTVMVERAGDVIPYVIKPVIENRPDGAKKIEFPEKCPSCSSKLVRSKGEAAWRCVNLNCPVQIQRSLMHFVSKSAMDITGMGSQTVKRFFEEGLIKSIPDIYKIDYEKIADLDGFGEQSAQNLKKAVENSKERPLYRLINGLGIQYVGVQTAKVLGDAVECIEDISDMKESDLENLQDIGEKVASSIYDFFREEKNIELIEALKDAGVNTCRTQEKKQKGDQLKGLTFVFTGTLENYTRDEAQDLVEQLGGRSVGSISSKVDYLVLGENPGSKLEEAKEEKDLKIIDEAEFQSMVG